MYEPTFTVSQIARHLKKTRSAVHVWIKKGELKAYEEDGRKFIPLSSLQEFASKRMYDISGLGVREEDDGLTPCVVATQIVVSA